MSGAKYWVTIHGGDPSAFSSTEVGEIIKAITVEANHVPLQAPPLFPSDIRLIAAYLDLNQNLDRAIKPCILISYTCMLRSSNVLSPNLAVWAGAHTLLAWDIRYDNGALNVLIRSTKTTISNNPTLLRVEPADSSIVCPIRAWFDYVRAVRVLPLGPAFVTNEGRPLTAVPVVAAMRAALKQALAPNFAKVSMHSLRRGAAQTGQRGGAPANGVGHRPTGWGLMK